ncbi:MAG TPA: hypothetical protein VNP73_08785 [Actinomycetota bacterium]|nr:hypothetical protein [Actinomycetota bacterium]
MWEHGEMVPHDKPEDAQPESRVENVVGLGAETVAGVVGAVLLTLGIYVVVYSTLIYDKGGFDYAAGQLYGVGLALLGLVLTGWSLVRLWRMPSPFRGRGRTWIAVPLVASALWFGLRVVEAVDAKELQDEVLAATAPVRHDFESDLNDAFRAWREEANLEGSYLGNDREKWSLDPTGDGAVDVDPPIVRAIRDMGWSERGLSVFDTDGDLVVDQIEWSPADGADVGNSWCIPVVFLEAQPNSEEFDGLYLVAYHQGVRGSCNVEPATNILSRI